MAGKSRDSGGNMILLINIVYQKIKRHYCSRVPRLGCQGEKLLAVEERDNKAKQLYCLQPT